MHCCTYSYFSSTTTDTIITATTEDITTATATDTTAIAIITAIYTLLFLALVLRDTHVFILAVSDTCWRFNFCHIVCGIFFHSLNVCSCIE